VRTPPRILIVDDTPANVEILEMRLAAHGYEILTAGDGEEALDVIEKQEPDLVLLDIMMPKINGIEVCRRVKANDALPFIPIILVTSKADPKDVVAGLEAGAEEYLTKPVEHTALVARVKSMLRIKELHDKGQEQAKRLEEQAAELVALNEGLEQRVAEQLTELEHVSQLKRFFSPQLAELIVSSGDEKFMESHRQEITVVFCDLRNFTEFSSTSEPEEQLRVLREYHNAVGSLIFRYEATLEHFAGDGVMAFFNDPVPCPDPAARAVKMSIAMRDEVGKLRTEWNKRGFELGFGVGIALGYATLGQVGFEGQFHYMAIGSVANLASRLCDQADDGQILITQRVYADVEDLVEVESIGELSFKGFHKPIPTYQVVGINTGES
jgi:adenylate cyclase